MTIQVLRDIVFPNGETVKAGGVLEVPDIVGASLIHQGVARLRLPPGPTERKVSPAIMPGDPLPPQMPYVRVGTQPQPAASYEPGLYEDQDNFVRDLVTYTVPFGWWDGSWWDWSDSTTDTPPPPVTNTPSDARNPVLDLPTIKLHCHIEPDQTEEDPLLTIYEKAARLHTENYLRYLIDETTVGENTKLALLLLIAHWYRNREAVSTGRTMQGIEIPLAYTALLSLERDYPIY
jgi:hypothetical protein